MKVLKIIGLILLVLVGFFFLMGIINPTVNYGHTIKVDKPVDEAWGVMQDVSKYDQWLAGFKSIELIEGKKNQLGSKYRVIVQPGEGQPDFEMIETLQSFKPNDHVTLKFDSDLMEFLQTTRFESNSPTQTTISTESEVKASNFIGRCMFGMMETLTGSFTAQETENIENLKKLINNNTDDYSPKPMQLKSMDGDRM